ncbi:L10-interacting MYB domain-containing protein-like [Gastrolobium bilobum]|uniref:L10-interacting MYB domain-containing protein-like n=1 Tax=Gastrolobium bilobum TaxID=150636 RepID=UPI002AB301BC|nr:L10-interacting MYB domain-containing protein-like [Gastrolobium bilobum]
MGSQTATMNDRSRTYWSPLMDRYFIDLMLEQLDRGNRVGHTFNKQAWTDMQTMFNAKFGSQCDKDVLKTRYANLWKQFNDVKNILSHYEFSWDDDCQMVVADECVWNAYIEAHPEARCYRTKSVLNFDDLCEIFGYTTADGRYSLSSHDTSFDNEGGSLVRSCNERPRTEWTAAMDQYFIELLLDQLDRGNTVNNEFNRKAWTEMLAMFNAKFGPQHTKRILRHRFRKLMKYYFVITKILKTPGFSWDTQQQMLAADDDVWDAYVKQHPHARWYRLKTFPNYQDLELIFRNLSDLEFSDLYPEKYYGDVASVIKAGDREGNRNPSVTDRTRTYWTPPMDRCLIDLLLEQVKNGNKLGQTFISRAWNDILNSFNKQFKSQYDKDVLKSRYKNLRKQFYDVFNILQHSGFSWDDITEMVVAADHVWDAYIKAHPEAGSIKVKTLPGYRKLCVIFDKESPDKICFSLSHNANSGVESPKLQTGSILLKCEGIYGNQVFFRET